MRRQSLRLEEDLVRVFVLEAIDLVFDARAIPRSDAIDLAREHRAPVEAGSNDLVRGLIRIRDPARHLLWMLRSAAHETEHRHRVEIAWLLCEKREIDAAAIDTRRC